MSATGFKERGDIQETYSFEVIDFAHAAHCLCSFNNRNSLDRNQVAETCTFAVHDTWHKNIGLDPMLLASCDDFVVGTDSLRIRDQQLQLY